MRVGEARNTVRRADGRAPRLRRAEGWLVLFAVLLVVVAVVSPVLRARAHGFWWVPGVTAVVAVGIAAGRAAVSAALRPVRQRLREARERLAAQSLEIACYAQ